MILFLPRTSNLRYRIIRPAGKKIVLPWLNWHAFRYTFATIGEQLGISLSDRQAQNGTRHSLDDSGVYRVRYRATSGWGGVDCARDSVSPARPQRDCVVGAAGLEPATLTSKG